MTTCTHYVKQHQPHRTAGTALSGWTFGLVSSPILEQIQGPPELFHELVKVFPSVQLNGKLCNKCPPGKGLTPSPSLSWQLLILHDDSNSTSCSRPYHKEAGQGTFISVWVISGLMEGGGGGGSWTTETTALNPLPQPYT